MRPEWTRRGLVQLGGFEPPTSGSTVSTKLLIFLESVGNTFVKLNRFKVLKFTGSFSSSSSITRLKAGRLLIGGSRPKKLDAVSMGGYPVNRRSGGPWVLDLVREPSPAISASLS
jgi:hypothetical protein